jgi:hypothetical protein
MLEHLNRGVEAILTRTVYEEAPCFEKRSDEIMMIRKRAQLLSWLATLLPEAPPHFEKAAGMKKLADELLNLIMDGRVLWTEEWWHVLIGGLFSTVAEPGAPVRMSGREITFVEQFVGHLLLLRGEYLTRSFAIGLLIEILDLQRGDYLRYRRGWFESTARCREVLRADVRVKVPYRKGMLLGY